MRVLHHWTYPTDNPLLYNHMPPRHLFKWILIIESNIRLA